MRKDTAINIKNIKWFFTKPLRFMLLTREKAPYLNVTNFCFRIPTNDLNSFMLTTLNIKSSKIKGNSAIEQMIIADSIESKKIFLR